MAKTDEKKEEIVIKAVRFAFTDPETGLVIPAGEKGKVSKDVAGLAVNAGVAEFVNEGDDTRAEPGIMEPEDAGNILVVRSKAALEVESAKPAPTKEVLKPVPAGTSTEKSPTKKV